MGKSKNKKHKNKTNNPTGLQSVQEATAEENELASSESVVNGSIASLVEQLQSTREEERECACGTIANLVSQPNAIPLFLKNNVVKIIGPLIMDQSWLVRKAALGALRNMTVDGDYSVCEAMVNEDAVTPLVMLLKKGSAQNASEMSDKERDTQADTFLQATHLLWNLCENCSTAVSIFNRECLLDILLPWLKVEEYGIKLSLVVAQCLHTVTEDNTAISSQLQSDPVIEMLCSIIRTKHNTFEELLFRSVAIGILVNVSDGQLASAQGSILQLVISTIAEVLDQNIYQLLQSSLEALHLKRSENGASTTEFNDRLEANKKQSDCLQEMENLVQSQKICLETVANLCVPDGEDSDWEDMDSSDASNDELFPASDMEVDNNASMLSPLCVPTEVHSAFAANDILNKVLTKTNSMDAVLMEHLVSLKNGQKLLNSLTSLQSRGLLCIHNMVSSMDQQALGGVDMLQQVYSNVFNIATTQQALKNSELLEAATSAMRAIVQSRSGLDNKNLVVNPSEVQFLLEIGRQSPQPQVRANAVRICAIMACILAQRLSSEDSELLKKFGLFLVEVACKDTELWVVAESLDAIFDVFAEDDTDPHVKSIGLVEKLQVLAPVLKSKISQQKKNLGEHLPIVTTARTNLVRFIKYKAQRM